MPAKDPLPRSPLLDLVERVKPVTLEALVAAHRGDSQNAPENTLAAFESALRHGADLVEFDVQSSADGDVVVIHDERVDRTTDGSGDVRSLSTAELREFSAGAWFASRYASEQVPLLDEVLDLCRGRAIPMIEIKVRRRKAPQAGQAIAQALANHGMEREAVVICREKGWVKELQQLSPATPLCYLTLTRRAARAAIRQPGVLGVDMFWKSLSLRLIAELRQQSRFVTPWTVNRAPDMDRLLLLGCEAIITDCPVLLRDRIEGFEFTRARDLRAAVLAGSKDLDLELGLQAGEEAGSEALANELLPSPGEG